MSHRTLVTATAGALALSTVAAMTACKSRGFNSSAKSDPASAKGTKTACVGVQGNGIRFPSHVGTFTALLEADVLPVATMGGSSGSLVGSAVMALLGNASVESGRSNLDGRELTKAQRAGLVLAATPDVLNSFLFLPSVQVVRDFLASVVQFAYTTIYGRALLGDDAARIVSLEATVGQGVLLTDFFMNADFKPVFSLPTYEARRKKVYGMWMDFAQAKEVTLGELLSAAAKPEDVLRADPVIKDVSDRLYYMFQRDVSETRSPSEAWRGVLQGVDLVRKSGMLGPLEGKLRDLKLTIPHPKLVWNAYLSRTKEGRFLSVPKGMVVHATFRRGTYRTSKGIMDFTESAGLETLFQGYTASEPLFSDLLKARASQASANKGFLPFALGGAALGAASGAAEGRPAEGRPAAGPFGYAYPAERVLVLRDYEGNKPFERGPFNETRLPADGERLLKDGRRGAGHAIAYSAGEPGPFRRLPLYISKIEKDDNPALHDLTDEEASDPKEGLVSFGGWSENVPLSTLALLDTCKDVDYFVTGAAPGAGNAFQEGAVRAALRGWDSTRMSARLSEVLFTRLPKGEESVKAHFGALNANVEFSRKTVKEAWAGTNEAASRVITNDLAFDKPSEVTGESDRALKALNGTLSNDRFALLIASYQRIKRNMPPELNARAFPSFGRELHGEGDLLAKKRSVAEIEAALAAVK